LALTISAGFTTTTTSPLKATRGSPSRRTLLHAFSVMDGISYELETPTTLVESNKRSRFFKLRKAGRLSSFWTATSDMVHPISTTRLRHTGRRLGRRKSASPSAATDGLRMQNFSCLKVFMNILLGESVNAARRLDTSG